MCSSPTHNALSLKKLCSITLWNNIHLMVSESEKNYMKTDLLIYMSLCAKIRHLGLVSRASSTSMDFIQILRIADLMLMSLNMWPRTATSLMGEYFLDRAVSARGQMSCPPAPKKKRSNSLPQNFLGTIF